MISIYTSKELSQKYNAILIKVTNSRYLEDVRWKFVELYWEDTYIIYDIKTIHIASTYSVELLEVPWYQETFSRYMIHNSVIKITSNNHKIKIIKC